MKYTYTSLYNALNEHASDGHLNYDSSVLLFVIIIIISHFFFLQNLTLFRYIYCDDILYDIRCRPLN